MFMRRYCLLLPLIVAMLIPAFSSSVGSHPLNNGFCLVDTIPIVGSGSNGEGPKSTITIPIVCTLSDSGTDLELCFLDDLGFVSVTLMNLSTGEIESIVLDSQIGIVDFPFSGDAGFYRIIITTSSGRSYHGSFII